MKQYLLDNLSFVLKAAIILGLAVIGLMNYKKILKYFEDKSTDITKKQLVTDADLKNPEYVIDEKLIKQYVDQIIFAVDKFGTDEMALDSIYQKLKKTDIQNTLALWNEYKNRHKKYSSTFGDFGEGLFGYKEVTLMDVLRSELTNTQNEKNVLANYTTLFKRANLI